MPDFWPHFVSGADLRNPWVDLFHVTHTHSFGGVDVSFGVYEIWPTSMADHLPKLTLIFLISDKPCQIERINNFNGGLQSLTNCLVLILLLD